MSPDWRWRDVEQRQAALREHPADRRHLLLLARLPFAPPRLIRRLDGVAGDASIYRSLARLKADGLIAGRPVPLRPGSTPQLPYLTDLGLGAIALDQGVDARDLAQRNRLRTADLLALLPGLPHLLACYELLGLLATSRPGRPDLLAWQRPWRRNHRVHGTDRSVLASLPAYAELAWDEAWNAFLLVPDLGTFPVRLYRPSLRRLLTLRRYLSDDLPRLVVATAGSERAALWREMLGDVARDGHEDPLTVSVTTWETASADLAGLSQDAKPDAPMPPPRAVRPLRPEGKPLSLGRRIPHQINDELVPRHGRGGAVDLGMAVTRLSPEAHKLLDLIGHHPFLPLGATAQVLGWPQKRARNRLRHLVDLGLARLVETGEVEAIEGALKLAELTRAGLRLVAFWRELPLAQAVRDEGLAGGGPTEPVGNRRQLVANLRHTLGVDAIFVAMIASARRQGGALRDWVNAAACARGRVRPDGYGLYYQNGRYHGFFLEYDRGTMGERALRAKFTAYYDYRDTARYRRDYAGFPTILVVAADNSAEERIARSARIVGIGRPAPLSLLLTTSWRLEDPRNSLGPLGPIWREPTADAQDRRSWPRTAQSCASAR